MAVFNPEVSYPCCWERKENLNALDSLYSLSQGLFCFLRSCPSLPGATVASATAGVSLPQAMKLWPSPERWRKWKSSKMRLCVLVLSFYQKSQPNLPLKNGKAWLCNFISFLQFQIIDFLMISSWNKKFLLYSLLGDQWSTPSRSSLCLSHYTFVPNHGGFRVGHLGLHITVGVIERTVMRIVCLVQNFTHAWPHLYLRKCKKRHR